MTISPMDFLQVLNLLVSGGVLAYVVRVEHRLTRLETLLSEHVKADALVYERIYSVLERRIGK